MWGCVVVSEEGKDVVWRRFYSCLKNSSALAIVLEAGAAGAFSGLGAAFLNPVSL